MHPIYLDNATTSFPKAEGVATAMAHYINDIGASINRASYQNSTQAALKTLSLREKLCALFQHTNPTHVVLTSGATSAINYVLKGYLKAGEHCLTSSIEHNAMMRPLTQLQQNGVSFSRIPANSNGEMLFCEAEKLIKPNTKLIAITHASNVCGTLNPLGAVAQLAKKHGIPLFVDAAQTAGHEDINFEALSLSALAVPAHKGLQGPQGIGALLLSKAFAQKLAPLIQGGTGSASNSEETPRYMPDKFEAGTLNLPGIYGWECAVSSILQNGTQTYKHQLEKLTALFLQNLNNINSIKILGTQNAKKQTGVISVVFNKHDNAVIADKLEQEYGILTRAGLHCAPYAHKVLGSFPNGSVRFSFGAKTDEDHINAATNAIIALAK